ncbi:MAG TPA: hypothetical protein VKM56_00770, partial [Verrucomicrobiae bacterium]|nr:hypothetical protein [Verrucomicrobiae bacterium]
TTPKWQLVMIPVCFPSKAPRLLRDNAPEAELRSAGQTGRPPLRDARSFSETNTQIAGSTS